MKKIGTNFRMFLWLTVLTGVIYPLLVTLIAQGTMKSKADGQLIRSEGKIIGAALLAQKFESDRYFWSRPSSIDYNPLASGGSGLGPISAKLRQIVKERQNKLAASFHVTKDQIPAELLFSSGSGLDPHMHVSTAYFQTERVAKARKLDVQLVKDLVKRLASQGHVNVLMLNIALDQL